MGAMVIEHVKVGDLPEAWRKQLAKPADARVTVRIEDETKRQEADAMSPQGEGTTEDPAFGIWRDHEDMADVSAYLRKIRAPRYTRDGTRSKG